jgi:hypothetical protein
MESRRPGGARSLLRPMVFRHSLRKGVWNSSLPNTSGVIRPNEPAAVWNTTFRMSLGGYGRPLTLDLKGKPALFTVANSQQFFNAALTARLLQMVRP